jgi:hypothetical protein
VIVESPNETKKIESALGSDFKVVASVGHIRDLPLKEMAVDLQTFEPTYRLTERGAQVVSRLKTLVASADEVYLALLQKSGLDGVRPRRCPYLQTSSRLEVEPFTDDCDGLRERSGTDAESAFDDARLAADVLREVEDCGLALA